MSDTSKQVKIHLSRLGKPERVYMEGFVDDDGIRLKTFSSISEPISTHLSEKFIKQGRILRGQLINSVSKYHFYNEFFSIVQYQDRSNSVLGYYCDIVTPLQRNSNEYFLMDLILDLWITPDLRITELDEDKFQIAVVEGVIPANLEKAALKTFRRLKSEFENGIFPGNYLR